MEYINEILKENKMLNNEFLQANKIDSFKDTYKTNYTNKHHLPKNIKRNKDGFIMLDEIPYIMTKKENKEGHNNIYWLILCNGSRVLLKEVEHEEMMKELLFKQLAKKIEIKSASYDIGILNNKVYLLSPSFLKLGEQLIDYYNLDYKNYEVDVEKLTNKAKIINQDLFVRKMLTIDMLTENEDRFPNNFRVIKSKKNIRICPLFDNGIVNGIRYNNIIPSINGNTSLDDVFSFLMQNEEYKIWVLNKILNKNLYDLNESIRLEKKIYIDEDITKEFEKSIDNGKVLLLDAFKNS